MDENQSGHNQDDPSDPLDDKPSKGSELGKQSNHPTPNDGQNQGDEKKSKPNPLKVLLRGHSLLDWLTFLFDVCLVMITGSYSFFALQQWKVMRDTLADSNDSSQRQLRAYMTTMQGNLESAVTPGVTPVMHVEFENDGMTPAIELRARVRIVLRSTEVREDEPDPPIPLIDSVAVVGARNRIGYPWEYEKSLTGADVEAIGKREKTLAVYGTLTYSDVYHKPHHLWFCSFYIPGKNQLATCTHHNRID